MVKSVEDYVGIKVTILCQDCLSVEGVLEAVEEDFLHLSDAKLAFFNQSVLSNRHVDEISISIAEVVCILKGNELIKKPTSDEAIH